MMPAAGLVEHFRTDLASLWPYEDIESYRLGLAVSGGADSLALLLLAHAALPQRVEVATIDHALRPESADEAALVADYCRELDVPHRTLRVEVGDGNLQDRARAARYAALGEWVEERELEGLATAHQMDDQVETFLMRLNRGSGLAGLAAIRALGTLPTVPVRLVRPLLTWRRTELEMVVRDAGWEPVADPSNDDDRFDRVRLRKILADADWIDFSGVERSARHLAEANDTLEWVVGREYTECVMVEGDEARYAALRTGIGGSLVKGGVIRSIFRLFGRDIDQGAAAELVAMLTQGRKANIAGVQTDVRDAGGERYWIFRPENPRRTG